MKFGRIQPNPRFEDFYEILASHPEWLKPWAGTFFRFQSISYPNPKDVLSGNGAGDRGGRWNAPGLATIYGSTTDNTALDECKANDRYYGVETKGPRLLVAIEAKLGGMLDLTCLAIRRTLGVTLKELAEEDWRKLLQSGKESTTQALGRAAAASRASGLLARSATVPQGVNIVAFPGANRADRMVVVEGDRLTRLGVRIRA
jgi:RES domain-containing protein